MKKKIESRSVSEVSCQLFYGENAFFGPQGNFFNAIPTSGHRKRVELKAEQHCLVHS